MGPVNDGFAVTGSARTLLSSNRSLRLRPVWRTGRSWWGVGPASVVHKAFLSCRMVRAPRRLVQLHGRGAVAVQLRTMYESNEHREADDG